MKLKLKSLTTLQASLAVSVVAHAALLAVRFVDPQRFDRLLQDTPLEVILVNARSKEKVDKAQASPRPRWPAAARPRRAAPPLPCPPPR